MPSKGCIMRKISTVKAPITVRDDQFFRRQLYPMLVVSRVTNNSGEGAGGPICGRITSPANAGKTEPEGCDHLC